MILGVSSSLVWFAECANWCSVGILDHTWSEWRNQEAIEQGLQVMVDASI